MSKARAHGLLFNDDVVTDGDVNACPVHDSFKEMAHGIYEVVTLGKHHYRPIGADPIDATDSTIITINETIDTSVFDRWRADAGYRPQNLVDWAKRRGIDPVQLKQSVRAQDASTI